MNLMLVIGGTRSGKSAHAERLAHTTGLPVRYVATADACDPAMAERITAHAAQRPDDWETIDAGGRLAVALTDARETCVLIDGIGVWIAGVMHRAGAWQAPDHQAPDPDSLGRIRTDVLEQIEDLLDVADRSPAISLIIVAEQAGEGLLPGDRTARAWLDMLGETTQRLAGRASDVELVVAGRALSLPGPPRTPRAEPAQWLRLHGDRCVRPGDADHAVNVLAGGAPDWLRTQLRDALEHACARYPDEGDATAALAMLHGRDPQEIVATNGAAEALWLIPAALRPTLAACVHPAFTEAEAALRAHAVPVVRVLRDRDRDFALDPSVIPAGADLVVVGNPASPSGTLDPASTVLALRRPGRVLVVDEAFMNLVPGEPATLVRERLDDVIVVRSLTKALAIPGLRAGYAVAPVALARRLRDVRPPWSANTLALTALAAAARRPDALAAIAERASAERKDLQRRLARVANVRTWPSAANFCLVQVTDGAAVLAALSKRRIAVRAAASFPGLGAGDLRLTARAAQENERLVAALAEAVNGQ